MVTLVKNENAKETQFSRRFPRRQYQNSVGVLHRGSYEVESGIEIGEGGLLFQTIRQFEIGSHVVLNFYVPKGGFVSVKALVLYALPEKNSSAIKAKRLSYGIKFEDLAFECRRMIRDYIAEKTYSEAVIF